MKLDTSHDSKIRSAKINFYPFNCGAALNKKNSCRLHVLNQSSAVIWCLLDEIRDSAELYQAYADHFNIPLQQAKVDIETALQTFTQQGLLASGDESQKSTTQALAHTPANTPDVAPTHPTVIPAKEHHPRRLLSGAEIQNEQSTSYLDPPLTQTYHLANLTWSITCPNSNFTSDWFSTFQHLQNNADKIDLQLDIIQQDNSWQLYCNQTLVAENLAADQVVPYVVIEIFLPLCAKQHHRLLLHAGVLVKDGNALLLPAESGSGKSTLTLTLAAKGWQIYSDELAAIDCNTLNVDPMPQPCIVKHPSVAVLEPLYPNLKSLMAHQRPDNKIARYLGTEEVNLAATNAPAVKIKRIISPQYNANSQTRLHKLAPLDALTIIANTGSSQRPLEEQDIQALLTLAEHRDCYLLEFNDVIEAANLINELDN